MHKGEFLRTLLAGEKDCHVKLAGGGAIVEPYDKSETAAAVFKQILQEAKASDGEGYAIVTIATSDPDPNSPPSMFWIEFNEERLMLVQDHPLYDE